MVVFYYSVSSARPAFDAVSELEKSGGMAFSAIASCFCAGILPMACQAIVNRSLPQPFLLHIAFSAIFCACLGVYVKGQYLLNAWIIGDNGEMCTVARKVVFDQFVISPFITYPLIICLLFRWRDKDFSCERLVGSFRDRRGLMLQYCSMNVTNWCTWIPGVTVIYSLPTDVQMPVWSVLVFFYSALLTTVSANAVAAALPKEAVADRETSEVRQVDLMEDSPDRFAV
ncbi:unnamed protein product [Polarella glacialis]|uniref:Uncharacterized protein n=1 Tax=Polarella glacialis TaxID=89957 RepID=A0A813JUK5_POLGL|nr:unnamed protein product [Polarella glacialis]